MNSISIYRTCWLVLIGFCFSACASNATPPPTAIAVAPTALVPTATEAPPSATATAVPSTATSTYTAIPPTATKTATNTSTSIPTLTRTSTKTATRAAPSSTRAISTTRPPTRASTASSDQMPEKFADSFDAPGILRARESDTCKLTYEGGQFHIRVFKQNYICWAIYPREYTDFVIDVDVVMHSGEGSCGGGASIVFGYKDNKNFYLLDVDRTCRGYHVGHYNNGNWETVRKWDQGLRVGASPAEGVTVTSLRIAIQGNQFGLFSNGEQMDTLHDSNYQGGRVGIAGGTWGQDTHVSFDNFRIVP